MELEPCPFCGSRAAVKFTQGNFIHHPDCRKCDCSGWQEEGWYVICNAATYEIDGIGCGAHTGYAETQEKAAEQWNRREKTAPA